MTVGEKIQILKDSEAFAPLVKAIKNETQLDNTLLMFAAQIDIIVEGIEKGGTPADVTCEVFSQRLKKAFVLAKILKKLGDKTIPNVKASC
jgi:hypothetical protein